jgi:ABC-type polysaccharide/polyol phosphate export permease
VVYEGQIPTIEEFLITGGIATITLVAGWIVFARKADEFAYRV